MAPGTRDPKKTALVLRSFVIDAQRVGLHTRLAYHRAHPDEPGMTITQLKTSLLNASQ